MRIIPQILRLLAALAVLLQLGLPAAHARALDEGVSLSSLICSPSGQSMTSEAEAHMSALLDLVGEDDNAAPPPDCDRCVTAQGALPSPVTTTAERVVFGRAVNRYARIIAHANLSPRGPPLGLRAPPRLD